jgi:1-acyl-sn-glycerol-3-phosphate acyltransferase
LKPYISNYLCIRTASAGHRRFVVEDVHIPPWPVRLSIAVLVLVGAPLLIVLAPALFLAMLLLDLLGSSRRFRLTRLLAMTYCYVALEWVGILMAAVLWVVTLGGLFMSTTWSRAMHYRVQRWWALSMLAAARLCLGVQVRFEGLDLIDSAPLIVAARHTSFFDALLPTVALSQRRDGPARHVMKRELAWDPCLGLFGMRHPNHFVSRDGGDRHAETQAIERLASTAGDDALVIFPEGTFFSAARSAKVAARMADSEPGRHARLRLTHLLPPRPGGMLALLRGRPASDLVFIGHTGFEPFGSLRSIAANVPFDRPVDVKLWRVAAADVPSDPTAQLRLIDDAWQVMDDWIATDRTEQRPHDLQLAGKRALTVAAVDLSCRRTQVTESNGEKNRVDHGWEVTWAENERDEQPSATLLLARARRSRR